MKMENQFKLSYFEALGVLDWANAWLSKYGYDCMTDDMKKLITDLTEYTNLICEKYGVEEGE